MINVVRVPPLCVVSKVPVRVHYLQLPIDIKCVVLGALYCVYSIVLLHPFQLHFMSSLVHFIPVFESGSWVIILFWSLIWCIMSRVFHRSILLTSRDRNTLLMPCYSLIRHRLSLYQSSLSIFILLTFQFIMAYVQFKVAVYYSSLKSLSVAQV